MTHGRESGVLCPKKHIQKSRERVLFANYVISNLTLLLVIFTTYAILRTKLGLPRSSLARNSARLSTRLTRYVSHYFLLLRNQGCGHGHVALSACPQECGLGLSNRVFQNVFTRGHIAADQVTTRGKEALPLLVIVHTRQSVQHRT